MGEKREDVTHSIAKLNKSSFSVSYDYKNPTLRNYDELKNAVEIISNRYKNYIITSEEEAREVNKRGGLLTSLRKVSRQINEYKMNVHRAAKNSYSSFDDKMNALNDLVNESIVSVKEQVDDYNKRAEIKRMNEMQDIFNDTLNSNQFKGKLPKWCNYKFFVKFNPKAYKESDKRRKLLSVQFLAKVYNDTLQMIKEFKKNYHSKIFLKSSIRSYMDDLDVNKAIRQGIDDYNEAIRLAKQLELEKQRKKEQESKRQQEVRKEERLNKKEISEVKEQKTGTVEKNSDKQVYYTFATTDLKAAIKIKKMLDSDGVDYLSKKVIR